MSKKICHCGRVVVDRCFDCHPQKPHTKTTKQRGYGHDWRKLSEYKRAVDALCEMCSKKGFATPATEVHHIKPINEAPHLRLALSNLLSVCRACHEELENG